MDAEEEDRLKRMDGEIKRYDFALRVVEMENERLFRLANFAIIGQAIALGAILTTYKDRLPRNVTDYLSEAAWHFRWGLTLALAFLFQLGIELVYSKNDHGSGRRTISG